MVVLLPEGRAINNPDTIKMVKVMPNNIQGKQVFVVSIKLDDDSELMIKSCSSQEEAETIAYECMDLINESENDSDDDSDSDSESDSEDSDSDSDSVTPDYGVGDHF